MLIAFVMNWMMPLLLYLSRWRRQLVNLWCSPCATINAEVRSFTKSSRCYCAGPVLLLLFHCLFVTTVTVYANLVYSLKCAQSSLTIMCYNYTCVALLWRGRWWIRVLRDNRIYSIIRYLLRRFLRGGTMTLFENQKIGLRFMSGCVIMSLLLLFVVSIFSFYDLSDR